MKTKIKKKKLTKQQRKLAALYRELPMSVRLGRKTAALRVKAFGGK